MTITTIESKITKLEKQINREMSKKKPDAKAVYRLTCEHGKRFKVWRRLVAALPRPVKAISS